VLSTYVQSNDDLNRNINGHWEMSHLCELLWNKHVRNQAVSAHRPRMLLLSCSLPNLFCLAVG
jgi:hypothetical protein